MKNVWTWGGAYFGYIDNDCLWTQNGEHIGKVANDEIFDKSGKYIGEIKNENRLIYCCSKSSRRGYSFSPYCSRVGVVPYVDYVGYVMYVGYEDFKYPR